jgi:hypothetical protein
MAQYTELVNINNTQAQTLTNVLLENYVSFYDWGFTNKGGYYNVGIPESGAYGGDKSKLYPSDNPNYPQGKVWQGHRGNWVWESGITYAQGVHADKAPTSVSGVWVDDNFWATGHSIDYANGRIFFDDPVDLTSNVQLNHSQKWLYVTPAKGISWLSEIQKGANRVDVGNISTYGSGNWATLGKQRIPLPMLAVDILPAKELLPLQLGGGQWSHNDIVYTVMTENEWECKNIVDIVLAQNDRAIYLYDSDTVLASGYSIYNYTNTLTDWDEASGSFPTLVDNFRHSTKSYIRDSYATDITELNPNLYVGTVRCTSEAILPSNKDFISILEPTGPILDETGSELLLEDGANLELE